jgi:tetratricopeptide (TPR) repeat protein
MDDGSEFDMDFTTHRYPNHWDENNWEQEMEQHPMFMTKAPEDGGLPPMVEALQQIKYDTSEMTVGEIVTLHKEDGNRAFKQKDYHQAIACYSEAIKQKTIHNDVNSILYANRAAAHYHLNNNRSALCDALTAIDLNDQNKKAVMRAIDCFKRLNNFKDLINFCDQFQHLDESEMAKTRSEAEMELKKQQRDERRKQVGDKKIQEARKAEQKKTTDQLKRRGVQFDESSFQIDSLNPDVRIKLNSQGQLLFPVLFLYPEFKQTDFVQEVNETTCLYDHLVEMFDKESPAWDTECKYKSNSLHVIHRNELNGVMTEIDIHKSIGSELVKHNIRLIEPILGFLVGPDLKKLRASNSN